MPLLEARQISKIYVGVKALDDVDFDLHAGEIHALLGENGAGKSTLIKVLTGATPATSGEVLLEGQVVRPSSTLDAQSLGIACVYQEVNLVPMMSVTENILLGRMPLKAGRIDWVAAHAQAAQALARLKLTIEPRRPLQSYSTAIQQLVSIARALSREAKVLVLDEPTSSLDEGEVAQLFEVLRGLKAEGMGIIFITHFLNQVDAVADRITILRNGRKVDVVQAGQISRVELISRMIGKEIGEAVQREAAPAASASEPLLKVEGLERRGFGPVDVEVRPGEVVGLAGLLGSGRTETARMIFGLDRLTGGQIFWKGGRRPWNSPTRALKHGMGFCPEDRKTEAIIPELSIRENIALALQARRGWLKRISRRRQDELAEKYRAELGIATPNIEKPIGQLSGGNQQKAILGRWLATSPDLLILDEPTRGIDVGARDEIERQIGDLCDKGLSILLISSEIDEVTRLSDRIVVLRDQRSVGELPGSADDQEVMHLIAGTEGS
jgi:simple sugar transport system ATP-binding protein